MLCVCEHMGYARTHTLNATEYTAAATAADSHCRGPEPVSSEWASFVVQTTATAKSLIYELFRRR